ncbi:NfeD family protein [Pararhodobacter sp. CCB-MM2]|uniref:NfeD family protein n=1 Tax=Pararhodobacter sp. CCB-MM2 TaxID=1786003 RepID=UPI000835EEF4|nr:hypothetical protein [Pararhodobacter sp. CCB-MM2]
MAELWWIWIAAGLALAILEVLVPGFLFAGFAVGAVITGAIVGTGLFGDASESLAIMAVVFAVISVVAWLGMRQFMGVRQGQMKRIDRDINED